MSSLHIHDLLDRIGHVLREDLRGVATAHGLALAQLEALQFLAVANRFSDSLSAVVAYLGATKGTVSQTLSALERKGFIVRERDPDDARRTHARLTEAGRAVVDEARPAPALREIDDPDVQRSLEGLLRAMLAARGGRAFGVCHTCRSFRKRDGGGWCALVDAPLAREETDKLCGEHSPKASPIG